MTFLIDNLEVAGKDFSSASDNGNGDNTMVTFTPETKEHLVERRAPFWGAFRLPELPAMSFRCYPGATGRQSCLPGEMSFSFLLRVFRGRQVSNS